MPVNNLTGRGREIDGVISGPVEWAITTNASTTKSLMLGRKTQMRFLSSSRLSAIRCGDRIWIRESFVAGRTDRESGLDVTARVRRAEFVMFSDGWRQYRDGSGRLGPPSTKPELAWTPAVHMPRWASRVGLRIVAVRREKLNQLKLDDIVATGLSQFALGLFWHWPHPAPGIWRDPFAAFAARWNLTHGTPGERWDDDPEVIVADIGIVARGEASGVSGILPSRENEKQSSRT